MTIKIEADGQNDIVFEVKGKISLSLTRQGIIYRNELVKDGGEVLRLMTEFLGLAEADIQDGMHEQIVQHTKDPQQRLDQIKDLGQTWLIIQASKSGEDDGVWNPLHAADVPDWVKESEVIDDLIKGSKVKANGGNVWYRAVHVVDQPDAADVH